MSFLAEEIRDGSVAMNPRIHHTAKKMGVDEPKDRVGAFRRPFRARAGGDSTQGSARGSTLSYIPAAAARLNVFVISSGANVMPNALRRELGDMSPGPATQLAWRRTQRRHRGCGLLSDAV